MRNEAAVLLAVERRRESSREEFNEQAKLARLLARHLPAGTFWTSLENKPLSTRSGRFQKLSGVRSGLPDLVVLQRKRGDVLAVFVELKSRRGAASEAQKEVRAEMLPTGAH